MQSFFGIDPVDFDPEFRSIIEQAKLLSSDLPDCLDGHVIYIVEVDPSEPIRVSAMTKDAAIIFEKMIDGLPDNVGNSILSVIESFTALKNEVLVIVISATKHAQLALFHVHDMMLSEGSNADN
ncbi:MAG TPA: hypothetical protein VIE65_02360 [Methylobacter sp.]